MHAKGESRIIGLSLGLSGRQGYHRDNRESQSAHGNVLDIGNKAFWQTGNTGTSQFILLEDILPVVVCKVGPEIEPSIVSRGRKAASIKQ
jgi:hypothetical protein